MKQISFLFSLVFLLNCASSNAGITTSNIPIVNKKYKVVAVVDKRRTWKAFDIGIIASAFSEPPINQMVNDAIKENEADALINIKYWQDRTIWGPITIHRFQLNAEAVKFEEESQNVPNKKSR